MPNVLFTRTSDQSLEPIIDGQILFDTSGNGKMYLDNGTIRLEMGGARTIDPILSKTSTNPIQNKAIAGVMLDNLEDIGNVTSSGFLPDALAIKELKKSVSDGKTLVANAITAKGVSTATDATFEDMANNIDNISTKPKLLGTYSGNQSSINIAMIDDYANKTFFITNPVIAETATPQMMRDHGNKFEYYYEARIWQIKPTITKSGSNLSVTNAQSSMWVKELNGPAGQPSSSTTVKMTYDIYYA